MWGQKPSGVRIPPSPPAEDGRTSSPAVSSFQGQPQEGSGPYQSADAIDRERAPVHVVLPPAHLPPGPTCRGSCPLDLDRIDGGRVPASAERGLSGRASDRDGLSHVPVDRGSGRLDQLPGRDSLRSLGAGRPLRPGRSARAIGSRWSLCAVCSGGTRRALRAGGPLWPGRSRCAVRASGSLRTICSRRSRRSSRPRCTVGTRSSLRSGGPLQSIRSGRPGRPGRPGGSRGSSRPLRPGRTRSPGRSRALGSFGSWRALRSGGSRRSLRSGRVRPARFSPGAPRDLDVRRREAAGCESRLLDQIEDAARLHVASVQLRRRLLLLLCDAGSCDGRKCERRDGRRSSAAFHSRTFPWMKVSGEPHWSSIGRAASPVPVRSMRRSAWNSTRSKVSRITGSPASGFASAW